MIYFIQSGKSGPIKIGYTDNNVQSRLAQLQTSSPYQLHLLWHVQGSLDFESEIHKKFKHENIRGEWFRPSTALLDFINQEASNDWEIELGDNDKTITIVETKEKINVDGSGGWWVEEQKDKNEIDVSIDYFYTCNMDVGCHPKGKYIIDIHKYGLSIKSDGGDLPYPFGDSYLLLEGEKIVQIEKEK